MQNVLRSLARNISTQVSNSTIEGDIKNNFDSDISRPTLTDYMNALENLLLLKMLMQQICILEVNML